MGSSNSKPKVEPRNKERDELEEKYEAACKLSDDELMAELDKEILEKEHMNLIILRSPYTYAYLNRNKTDKGLFNMDNLKPIIDKYNKPYFISIDLGCVIKIQFINIPKTS
jgi:hypothetical protein